MLKGHVYIIVFLFGSGYEVVTVSIVLMMSTLLVGLINIVYFELAVDHLCE